MCVCNETAAAQGIFSKLQQCAAWSLPQHFLQKQCEEACPDFPEGLRNAGDLLKSSSNNFQHKWKLFQGSSSLLLTASWRGSPNAWMIIKSRLEFTLFEVLRRKMLKETALSSVITQLNPQNHTPELNSTNNNIFGLILFLWAQPVGCCCANQLSQCE